MRSGKLRVVSIVLASIFGLGACSNSATDDTEATPDASSTVDVAAEDFAFTPADIKVPAGSVTVNFTNNGTVPHTFTLEEDTSVDTGTVAPGESKSITFDAPTEETDFICTIHYESKNMEGKIGPE